jgi:hypothetical protein
LLGDGRGCRAGVPEPLVPLGRDLYVCVVGAGVVLGDATEARGGEGVAEFPVGGAGEVHT